jgi:type I restriction enzyme S subunit
MTEQNEFYKESDFQESPIGRIPKEWQIAKIEDLAQTSSGGTPSRGKKEYFGGNIPWVKSGELKDNSIYDTEEKITQDGLKNSAAKIFPKGTLVVALYGATVGKTGILGIDATTNQAVCAILPNDVTFDAGFLRYYLIFKREQLIAISAGGAQPNISQEIIRMMRIALPSIQEQQKIVRVLSAVDLAVAKTGEVIAKTERLKKGLMQELLTKGIGHKEYKQTPIGKTPKIWQTVKLGDVLTLLTDYEANGSFSLLRTNVRVYDKSNYAWYVRATDLENDKHPPVEGLRYIDRESYEFLRKTKLYGNELLLTKRGQIGKVYLMPKIGYRATLGPNLYLLNLNEELVSPDYLFYFFTSSVGQTELTHKNASTTLGALYKDDVKRMRISLPSPDEQGRIVSILSSVDKKLQIEHIEKMRLERIKQGLMDLLLTGKIRVKMD